LRRLSKSLACTVDSELSSLEDRHVIHLNVYRNLKNRALGSPDDGPLAWEAHSERRKILEELLTDDAFEVRDWGQTKDEESTHELVEIAIDIIRDPTLTGVAVTAGLAILKLLAKPLEKKLEAAVQRLFGRLFVSFREKKIGDFWITLPDGTMLKCLPGATIEVRLPDGQTRIAEAPADS
jgi:hypothetical protein